MASIDELRNAVVIVRLPDGRYYPTRGGKYAIRMLPAHDGTAERISFATADEAQAFSEQPHVGSAGGGDGDGR